MSLDYVIIRPFSIWGRTNGPNDGWTWTKWEYLSRSGMMTEKIERAAVFQTRALAEARRREYKKRGVYWYRIMAVPHGAATPAADSPAR